MGYDIVTTQIFDQWLQNIKQPEYRARIINRLRKLSMGHLGDHKSLGNDLFEMRFFFGPGYRVYYTHRADKVVILLCGGDKSTQQRDIEKALKMLRELE